MYWRAREVVWVQQARLSPAAAALACWRAACPTLAINALSPGLPDANLGLEDALGELIGNRQAWRGHRVQFPVRMSSPRRQVIEEAPLLAPYPRTGNLGVINPRRIQPVARYSAIRTPGPTYYQLSCRRAVLHGVLAWLGVQLSTLGLDRNRERPVRNPPSTTMHSPLM